MDSFLPPYVDASRWQASALYIWCMEQQKPLLQFEHDFSKQVVLRLL